MRISFLGFLVTGALINSALTAEPIQIQMPPEKQAADRSNFLRDSVIFLLSGFYTDPAGLPEIENDGLTLDPKFLPEPFLKAIADRKPPISAGIILGIFKHVDTNREIGFAYQKNSRTLWHREHEMPDTVEALEKQTGFSDVNGKWTKHVEIKSGVKGLTRAIYRSPVGDHPMAIAVTHQTETGDLQTEVRETEVIIKREGNSNWDFYVYDSKGKLALASPFLGGKDNRNVTGPSPVTCLTCHYNPDSRNFTRQPSVMRD